MPLQDGAIYAIHNDLTDTVLDLAANVEEIPNTPTRGWGRHGKNDQRWKIIRDGPPADKKWMIQNQRDGNQGRFLSTPHLVAGSAVDNLLGGKVTPPVNTEIFVIERIPGASERYRIKFGTLVVALGTVGGTLDRHSDGPPIALQNVENDKKSDNYRAQLWSFLPAPQLPVEDGIYEIVNRQTGLVLDLAISDAVHGLVGANANQKWKVVKDTASDCYTFESSRVAGTFLGLGPVPEAGSPGNVAGEGTALHGRDTNAKQLFTIRKVPGTRLYKVFFNPLANTTNDVKGLAVNLVNGVPGDVAAGPAILRAQTAALPTQTWFFI